MTFEQYGFELRGSIYMWVFKNKHYAAAAAAKSLQSCLTLCDPIDGSPPGSLVPGILQARILEWVAISFSNAWKWKVKVKLLSRVLLFVTPWTAAYQAPPSMEFSGKSTGMGWRYGSVSLSLSRLWSMWLDWLVFCDCGFSVFPLMPPLSAYCLTWVSLTLDVGYLFTAAPAKHSRCSLPRTWVISSLPPLLTLDMGYLLTAATPDLGHGVSWYVAFYLASFIYQVFKIHHILIQQRSHLGSNHTPGTQVARLVPITLKKKLLICSLTWWYISQFTCFCHFDKKFWNFEFIHLNIQTIYRDRTNLAFLKAPP